MTQRSRGRRRGEVFPLRLTQEERAELEQLRQLEPGPRGLGPWLVWRALQGNTGAIAAPGITAPATSPGIAAPGARGITSSSPEAGITRAREAGITRTSATSGNTSAGGRRILDLCGGSGAWSAPYVAAGYEVELVTLPALDVREYEPPSDVWGVLAAPPCAEFSRAKNGKPRDFAAALEPVVACLRIIALARPAWWVLENPSPGQLSRWLGTPRFAFEPYEFGDAWSKHTALWGDFTIPRRGPFVEPLGSAMDRATADERAITPPGFARAFQEANP